MDWQDQPPEKHEPDIDEAFRLALRQQMSAAEPPDHVWQRLRSQITADGRQSQRLQQARHLSRLLAPLAQGLLATFLLLLLGVGMRVSLWEQAYRFSAVDARRPPLAASLTPQETLSLTVETTDAAETADDHESLRTLLRTEGSRGGRDATPVAKPHVHDADQRLTALDRLDDRIDTRDVSAPAVVTHPVAGAKAGSAPHVHGATPPETLSPERVQPF